MSSIQSIQCGKESKCFEDLTTHDGLGLLLRPELTLQGRPNGTVTNCLLPMHRREEQLKYEDKIADCRCDGFTCHGVKDLMLNTECFKYQELLMLAHFKTRVMLSRSCIKSPITIFFSRSYNI